MLHTSMVKYDCTEKYETFQVYTIISQRVEYNTVAERNSILCSKWIPTKGNIPKSPKTVPHTQHKTS